MTIDALIAAAMREYRFRARRGGEDKAQYIAVLVEHVMGYDFAAAHELRVGKVQANWSLEDVRAFQTIIAALPHAAVEFTGTRRFVIARSGPYDVTPDGLRQIATCGLEAMIERRIADPRGALPIMASVLLTDGALLVSSVHRNDRVAFVTQMARTEPVYGFLVVGDMWWNHSPDGTRMVKRDAIVMHVGSRDQRVMKIRPYDLVSGAAVFDLPSPDMDLRNPPPQYEFEDPYASVFVSIAAPTGPSA